MVCSYVVAGEKIVGDEDLIGQQPNSPQATRRAAQAENSWKTISRNIYNAVCFEAGFLEERDWQLREKHTTSYLTMLLPK